MLARRQPWPEGPLGRRIVASGNLYTGRSALERRQVRGTAFSTPYAYMLAPAADVPALVTAGVGPK